MILQRMAGALKRQDWFQVVIEVAIVVIGIFLGLQVQAWYDAREARTIENQIVDYMTADIENTIAYTDRMEDYYYNEVTAALRAIELLENEQLSSTEKQEFEKGMLTIGRNNGLDNYINTFHANNLEKISGPTFRRTLDNFVSRLNASKNVMQNTRASMQAALNLIRTKVAIGDDDRDLVIVHYDFGQVRNDDNFRTAMYHVITQVQGFEERNRRMGSMSRELLPILRAYRAGEEIQEVVFQ